MAVSFRTFFGGTLISCIEALVKQYSSYLIMPFYVVEGVQKETRIWLIHFLQVCISELKKKINLLSNDLNLVVSQEIRPLQCLLQLPVSGCTTTSALGGCREGGGWPQANPQMQPGWKLETQNERQTEVNKRAEVGSGQRTWGEQQCQQQRREHRQDQLTSGLPPPLWQTSQWKHDILLSA